MTQYEFKAPVIPEIDKDEMSESRKIEELRKKYVEQNDPLLVVQVAEVPHKNILPDILYYRANVSDKEAAAYPPQIDKNGIAHYRIPRVYAQRLLQNFGGRKFVLIYPYELVINVQTPRHGTKLKRVRGNRIAKDKHGKAHFVELDDKEIKEAYEKQEKTIQSRGD